MKKIQRIFAFLGVVLLLAMYGATMVFAISGSPNSEGWFKASIACTIIVPVFLYANVLIYRYLKNRDEKMDDMKQDDKAKNKKNEDKKS